VVDNWSLDIMHVCLEGIVPFELSCILNGLCNDSDSDHITLEMINRDLLLFWGKITVEKTHKPAEISKVQQPGHGLSPSMKAVQYQALLKYLPLALGCKINPNNKHWKFLLHLSLLIDLIFAPRFTHGVIAYLKEVISDHSSRFIKLYGDQAKLRPKHHLLVHMPSIILKSGPLIGLSCMRYELKNSFFRRCAHVVCNFTNICHTLAYRHQQYSLYSQLATYVVD
jgi:hypothetical protein